MVSKTDTIVDDCVKKLQKFVGNHQQKSSYFVFKMFILSEKKMHKRVCLCYDLRKIVQNSLCTYEDMFIYFFVVVAASSFGIFFRSEDLEHFLSCKMKKKKTKFYSSVRNVCFVGSVQAVVRP